MEDNGETPWEACRREVYEESGLVVESGRLVCIDFLRPRPDKPGGMRFLFDCGAFDDETLAGVVIQEGEIAEHRFVDVAGALELLSGPLRRRVGPGSGRRAPSTSKTGGPPKPWPGGRGRAHRSRRVLAQLRRSVPGRESSPSGTGSPSMRIGTPFTRTWVMPTG